MNDNSCIWLPHMAWGQLRYYTNKFSTKSLYGGNELLYRYCSHPTGAHSNGICAFKVAFGEAQMPWNHHFVGPMPCSVVPGTVWTVTVNGNGECLSAAIYLIAAYASPRGFLWYRKFQSNFLYHKKRPLAVITKGLILYCYWIMHLHGRKTAFASYQDLIMHSF